MVAISIIVPAYNVAPYLQDCLDSILKQTFTDWELILVDDGSTDNTREIGLQNASTDKRIKYYRKTNSGVSSTRNFGLDQSMGKYIMFLDSDDFCHPQMLELLFDRMKSGVGLSTCLYERFVQKPVELKTISKTYSRTIYKIPNIYITANRANIIHTPWAKLYLRSIIEKYSIRFNENLALGEDLCFNLEYLDKIDSASILEVPLYYYRDTICSLSKNIRSDYADIQFNLLNKKMDFIAKHSIPFDFSKNAPGMIRDIAINILKSNASKQEKIARLCSLRHHKITQICRPTRNVKDILSTLIIKYVPSKFLVAVVK
ncbi:MAG: glycosyltransferase [Muribaculaceae bacterium]|nr:glycosyltransferase [Muribaculaceae bacterium]